MPHPQYEKTDGESKWAVGGGNCGHFSCCNFLSEAGARPSAVRRAGTEILRICGEEGSRRGLGSMPGKVKTPQRPTGWAPRETGPCGWVFLQLYLASRGRARVGGRKAGFLVLPRRHEKAGHGGRSTAVHIMTARIVHLARAG